VEESVLDFEVLVSPVRKAHQAMWAFSGLAHGAHGATAAEDRLNTFACPQWTLGILG
jgi:hypothetical protein